MSYEGPFDAHHAQRLFWLNHPPTRRANEFTAKEIAVRLGVTVQTVKNRVTAGKYRGRTVKGVLLVNGKDIDDAELAKLAGIK